VPYADGVVAKLHVERIPKGGGRIYPAAGSGLQATDGFFQDSIQNAWWAAVHHDKEQGQKEYLGCDYDLRWWIEARDKDELRGHMRLGGRSAELALACAVHAAAHAEQVDQLVSVSARFKEPCTTNFHLTYVGKIDHKVEGARATSDKEADFTGQHDALRLAPIEEILVAHNQPEVTKYGTQDAQETTIANGEIKLTPILDFRGAYQRFSRIPRLTAHARRVLCERSGKLLNHLARPYVLNPITQRQLVDDPTAPSGKREEWVAMQDADVKRLLRGTFFEGEGPVSVKPIQIVADSGFGKSTLLLAIEHRLTKDADGLFPLRLGASPERVVEAPGRREVVWLPPLSTINWSGDLENVFAQLDAAYLLRLLPKETKSDECVAWISELVRRGKVFFLLDAIDQTDGTMATLASLVRAAGDSKCPLLLTGRPDIVKTKLSALKGAAWTKLRLAGLRQADVKEYLGSDLTWQHSEWFKDWDGPNPTWRPLLEIPLLLSLVRALAESGDLQGLKNREAIYARTIDKLEAHGRAGLEDTGRSTDKEFSRVFAGIAYRTLIRRIKKSDGSIRQEATFTGVMDKRAYQKLVEKDEELVKTLRQINFVTIQALVEYGGVEQGRSNLSWRHLSFCEYFFAVWLLDAPEIEQEELIRRWGRDPQWQWVFRFAVCMAERLGRHKLRDRLVRHLVAYGAVFFVRKDLIVKDEVKLPERLEQLVRWLVHLEWPTHMAWEKGTPPPRTDHETLKTLKQLFDRRYRDSRCLRAAWMLVTASEDPLAVEIRADFLGEFRKLVEKEVVRRSCRHGSWKDSLVLQLLPDEELVNLEFVTAAEFAAIPYDARNYSRCPPAELNIDCQPFLMESRWETEELDEQPQQSVSLSPFFLQRMHVTNAQFELFDPGHAKFRSEYSVDDRQSAVEVSCGMARMMSLWVDGYFSGQKGQLTCVRLPHRSRMGVRLSRWLDQKF